MKQKILVSGANGQLGQEIRQASSSFPVFEFIFLSREELSINDAKSVEEFFHTHNPAYFINCAAYTAVDKAETEQEIAFDINAKASEVLATACKQYNTRFIHISTDYVFDGTSVQPYAIDAQTNPQSIYGSSKLKGEELALMANKESLVIRTSWVYSEFGKNFVKTMLRLMKDKPEINVVSDQVGCPTYAADLAMAIMKIISSGEWKGGIYHYSNAGVISWYEFALAIKELAGSECKINPIPSSQYPTPAKRPGYSVLDTSAIQKDFAIVIPEWKDSLEKCLARL